MKKILVTTDFSAASKSAIRFAIQWSTQQKLQLVFMHVLYIPKPTSWSTVKLDKYVTEELDDAEAKLKNFIADIYEQLNIVPKKIATIVIEGLSAYVSIGYYLDQNPGFDCICIATRGAGKFKKIFGTNTGNLITNASIPVLAIPAEYKAEKITTLMYATDMKNFKGEAAKVIEFAKPLKAKIEMVHFAWPNEILFDEDFVTLPFKKQFKYGLEFTYEKNDAVHSLINRLESKIRETKPSIVVMFTNQQRSFFQKLFLSSKSEELSFKTKVPMLVFNKEV